MTNQLTQSTKKIAMIVLSIHLLSRMMVQHKRCTLVHTSGKTVHMAGTTMTVMMLCKGNSIEFGTSQVAWIVKTQTTFSTPEWVLVG